MTEPALDRASMLPLYYQLRQWLVGKIDSGELKAGDRVPTEQELCSQMGLSRGTVRAALSDLISEGRLYMVRGRGTYVAHHEPQGWSLGSFVSISEALAQQGRTFERRVLDLLTIPSPPSVATALRLGSGSQVIYLKRLWLTDGEPLMIAISYLPEKLAAGLVRVDLNNRPLYHALDQECGIHIRRVERTLGVRLADEAECVLLNLIQPAPVYLLDDLAYEVVEPPAEARPVEYSQTIIRGDKQRFEIQSIQVGPANPET
jgi:GntR family transcriptional regulator